MDSEVGGTGLRANADVPDHGNPGILRIRPHRSGSWQLSGNLLHIFERIGSMGSGGPDRFPAPCDGHVRPA